MAQLSTSKQHILKNMDGVKDIKVRHASPEARRQRDFSKDGSAVDAGYDGALSDEEARNERYGM